MVHHVQSIGHLKDVENPRVYSKNFLAAKEMLEGSKLIHEKSITTTETQRRTS
jgi:hypothetical protein